MPSLERLLAMVEENLLLARLTLEIEDVQSLLNQRDSDAFSQGWMEAHRRVQAAGAAGDSSSSIEAVERVRQSVYIRVFERWRSPDLAAYISDDFGLMAEAFACGLDDPWVNALHRSYENGVFPVARDLFDRPTRIE